MSLQTLIFEVRRLFAKQCLFIYISFMLSGVLFLCQGCLAPPIFFPKTSVHGVVVDQDDKPVPNVKLEARYYPYRLNIWATPTVKRHFYADEKGEWSFSARKVQRLYVDALPPAGYKPYCPPNKRRATLIGPFCDGVCPTNNFVLRLEKLPKSKAGKR